MTNTTTPTFDDTQIHFEPTLLEIHMLVRYWRQRASDIRAVATPSKPSLIKWWSAPDFAARTPVDIPWICEPFLAEKAITEIDGKVKNSGKSTFACAMTKKILNGQPSCRRDESTASKDTISVGARIPAPTEGFS